MERKTVAVVGIVAVLIIALLALAVIGIMGLSLSPIDDGTYRGQTVDYSHQRGIVFQTNDLTTKTHERSSQREDWCVPDDDQELIEQVRNIPEGSEVRIDYHRPLWIWPGTCEGGLKVIDSIEVLNSSATN